MNNIADLTSALSEATLAFYGACLTRYPELLTNPDVLALEAEMKRPVPPDMEAKENPVYRLLVWLADYQECDALPEYDTVYAAFNALTEACHDERKALPS